MKLIFRSLRAGSYYKIILALILFHTVTKSYSQLPENYFYRSSIYNNWIDTNSVYLGVDYYASPTSVIGLAKYFLPVQYANDEQLRRDISNGLANSNYFGTGINSFLSFTPIMNNLFGKDNMGLNIQLRSINSQDIIFTKGFFDLLYEGNSAYAGETVNGGPLNYVANSYQELQFNITTTTTDNFKGRKAFFSLGISFIKGSLFTEIECDRATLFTSSSGDSLNLDLNLLLRMSDSDKKHLLDINGVGSAFNAKAFIEFKNKNSLFISIDDLGFIAWDNNSGNFSIDSSISYTGVDPVNEDPFAEGSYSNIVDTFEYIRDSMDRESYNYFLPLRVSFAYVQNHVFANADLIVGMSYRYFPDAIPMIYSNLRFNSVSKKGYLQPGLILDEFGNFGLSLEAGTLVKNRISILLGTHHLEGILTRLNGQSMYISLNLNY